MKIKNYAKELKHQILLKSIEHQKSIKARSLRKDPVFRQVFDNLELTFDIPPLPKVQGIWGIAMVKNESDIIEQSIRHLFSQGIDHIFVVDNNSSDGTYELLIELSKELSLSVGRDYEQSYYQSEKMTWLSDQASKNGATWILPFDSDEFWYGRTNKVSEILKGSKDSVLEAEIYNEFPQNSGKWLLDRTPHREKKICFRPSKNAIIEMGNHSVLRAGIPVKDKLVIVHRPWRTSEQFRQKIRQGATSINLANLPDSLGYHWRELGKLTDTELNIIWENLISGEQVPDIIAWKPSGELIEMPSQLPDHWNNL